MMTALFVRTQCLWGDLRERARDQRGATAVEYGVLVALIIAVLVVVIASIGTKTSSAFNKVDSSLK
ncbi:MAG TPA: Flp family type IVb pilin [Actinomycetota bacterium]|nr:Flp family type IVb pilin [Actinomycetota bacterium]